MRLQIYRTIGIIETLLPENERHHIEIIRGLLQSEELAAGQQQMDRLRDLVWTELDRRERVQKFIEKTDELSDSQNQKLQNAAGFDQTMAALKEYARNLRRSRRQLTYMLLLWP
jgi:hypothetical protein